MKNNVLELERLVSPFPVFYFTPTTAMRSTDTLEIEMLSTTPTHLRPPLVNDKLIFQRLVNKRSVGMTPLHRVRTLLPAASHVASMGMDRTKRSIFWSRMKGINFRYCSEWHELTCRAMSSFANKPRKC